jgi:hypothetical protein
LCKNTKTILRSIFPDNHWARGESTIIIVEYKSTVVVSRSSPVISGSKLMAYK